MESKDKKPLVAVALDGVLARDDKETDPGMIGEVIPGAVEFVQGLIDEGFAVGVWTRRTNTALFTAEANGQDHLRGDRWEQRLKKNVEQWCLQSGFPLFSDNFFVCGPGKPDAVAFVDTGSVPITVDSTFLDEIGYKGIGEVIGFVALTQGNPPHAPTPPPVYPGTAQGCAVEICATLPHLNTAGGADREATIERLAGLGAEHYRLQALESAVSKGPAV